MDTNVKENSQQDINSWIPLTPEKPNFKRGDHCNTTKTTQESSSCDINSIPSITTTYKKEYLDHEDSVRTSLSLSLEDDLGFGGLTCLEILNMAQTTIGGSQDPSQQGASSISFNEEETPSMAHTNTTGGNQDQCQQGANININERTNPSRKAKKDDVNNKKRKAGLDLNQKPGEKRQKYYWAKINDSNKLTPKPKTPKAKTPKPARKRNEKKVKIEESPIFENVESEGNNEGTCKRSLQFGNVDFANLEGRKSEEVSIEVEKRTDEIEAKGDCISLKVYRRSTNRKYFNRNGRSSPNSFECEKNKKRAIRIKRPNSDLKRFETLDDKLMRQDFYSLVSLEGKSTNLLPKILNIVQDSFKGAFRCVLSLLSTSMNIKKKKRSTKRLPKQFQYVVQDNNEDFVCSSKCKLEDVRLNERSPKSDEATSTCQTKESKVKIVKEKKSGQPKQRKKNRKDFLSELHDWSDESLKQIMGPLIHYFEALKLYDDPKKLEAWSIMTRPQDGPNLMAEKIIMKEKALRFILTMRIFQGRKDFVEWKGSVLDSVVGVYLTQNVSDVLSSNAYMKLASKYPITHPNKHVEESLDSPEERNYYSSQGSSRSPIVELPKDEDEDDQENVREHDYSKALKDMLASLPDLHINKEKDEKSIDWEAIRAEFAENNQQRNPDTNDSVDWDAVRKAPDGEISEIIKSRGQHRIIAAKIQKTLNRLVDDHGTLDLEWLRRAPSKVAKAYLLSFYGLGLKSVECLRLLTLKDHGGFPVDVNIKRIAVRLGWVPLQQLPDGMSFHLLEKYPLENDVQQYLLPRLSELTQDQRYELHYQMITFGKIFCTKKNPNCRACPFKGECEYYKSQVDSVKQNKPLLTWKKDGKLVVSRRNVNKRKIPNPFEIKKQQPENLFLSAPHTGSTSTSSSRSHTVLHNTTVPIVQQPDDDDVEVEDIEDIGKAIVKHQNEMIYWDDLLTNVDVSDNNCGGSIDAKQRRDFIPEVKNVVSEIAKALVCGDASFPLPKHINPNRLRTEHQVYELPYDHALLKDMERQIGDVPYLLAIFPQGIDNGKDVSSHHNTEEASLSNNVSNETTVPGVILIPIRTALRGFFPLNGTYFQVNEVFVDHETSLQPINVPRELIWNLPKRTLYCGTGASSIYRGLSGKDIIKCNWSGFVCTRAFNRQTRAPEELPHIFHKRGQSKGKGKQGDEEEDD